MRKKILLIGNYKDAIYHPLGGVDEEMRRIFPDAELICTDDTGMLLELEKERFCGLISYLDIWKGALSEEEARAVLHFVDEGGALLLLHNGISIQSRDELKKMIGGKFTGHPPKEVLRFKVRKQALTDGCEDFALDEEPYRFELEEDGKNIFLTYDYHGEECPAGWSKTQGKGRVVFLAPGHTAESFADAAYGRLIRKCMDWCLGALDA